MTVPFGDFHLIYPPHPGLTWKPEEIHQLPNHVAQLKYDDWHALVYVLPDGRIEFYGRKKNRLSSYRPPHSLLNSLQSLPLERGKLHVLDGGLLHYKTARVRNTLVLWDILVHSGEYLLGSSYGERYQILKALLGNPRKWVRLEIPEGQPQAGKQIPVALEAARQLWLAPIFRSDLNQLYENASRLPEIEGLVLKDLTAPLRPALRADENATWQIRARKPRVDYRF
jgi:hypothetical protein